MVQKVESGKNILQVKENVQILWRIVKIDFQVAVKREGGRFKFSNSWIQFHSSQLLSVENQVLYPGSSFTLGGPEGIRAMNSQIQVCAWMQFSLRDVQVKLHQGDLLHIAEHTVILSGFQRSIHSDTYAFFVTVPAEHTVRELISGDDYHSYIYIYLLHRMKLLSLKLTLERLF